MRFGEHSITPVLTPVLPAGATVTSVVQPVIRLDDGVVVGYEALARVHGGEEHSPLWWLERAAACARRTEMEIEFLASAARLGSPPNDAMLFVNLGPEALGSPAARMMRPKLPERVVVEITEQTAVDDYAKLKADLEPWISTGSRVAIDDAGAGYSSLRHVVELMPDFLKLDRTLVQQIDRDSHKEALVRALAAFAREVGTSVIAEGIETPAELATLVSAGIPLGQGYLLGRPSNPWPEGELDLSRRSRSLRQGPEAGLRAELQRARNVTDACEAVSRHLFRLGQAMPSVYLEKNGQLRCVAQRGLWQVLDGLRADAGITGRVWATGESIEIPDVRVHSDYLEAVPGCVSEVCVPVHLDGRVIRALALDCLSPLPSAITQTLKEISQLLSRRLSALGWRPDDSPWQRAVHGSIAFSDAGADGNAANRILTALMNTSKMDSAGMIRLHGDHPVMESAVGPLREALCGMDGAALESICRLVERLSCCYTGNETTGLPYLGSEVLRSGGARAAAILPLWTANASLGAVVLAHSRPMRLTAEVVEPLELLAGQAAATLNAIDLVNQIRQQALRDGLTGLLNRKALDEAIDRPDDDIRAVIITDVDHFKVVNERHGHPRADQALKILAEKMTELVPESAVYRMGGDEFVCLIPTDDSDTAGYVAEKMRRVGKSVLAPWSTTLSVGVAVSEGREPLKEILIRADAALFEVKRRGGGRVAVAS